MKPTRAQLQHKIKELEAQLAHVYHFVDFNLNKVSSEKLMGSGVLIQMHFLGGTEVCPPFVIKDGLNPETIAALRQDLVRSYERATEFKPKGTTA